MPVSRANPPTVTPSSVSIGGKPLKNTSNDAQPQPTVAKGNANKIWSTSTTEERERIKDFWLGLGQQERRNLVKIDKDTVLKKMKEQQKHGCSCAVCGRKRNAMEEELEVLYDAYYEELEQYAAYQQRYVSSGGTIPPPPGPGPFPGSVELDKYDVNNNQEEDHEENENEDEDQEEDEDDKDIPHSQSTPQVGRIAVDWLSLPPSRRDLVRALASGLRNIAGKDSNGLTVTGPSNILSVADDLLNNDGQMFLEMMEQLAEQRMQREEDAAADVEDEEENERGGSDIDGDDGDDGGSEEEDEEEEEEEGEEMMTEEQKMEEGKRMFSIFAARTFEPRILQAYREKVAQETYMQLLRDLHEEDDEDIPHPQPTTQRQILPPLVLEEKTPRHYEMKNPGHWTFWVDLWALCRVAFSAVLVASSIVLVVFSVVSFSVVAFIPVTKIIMDYAPTVLTGFGVISATWFITRGEYVYRGPPSCNPLEEGEERETINPSTAAHSFDTKCQ